MKETDISQLSDEEKLSFVKDSTNLSLTLCEGVSKPSKEAQLDLLERLDSRTFYFHYLVEKFHDDIIVRCRQRKFCATKENDVNDNGIS